jgi:hypothetical protein
LADMRGSNLAGADSRALVVNRLRYLVGHPAQVTEDVDVEDVDVEPLPVPRFSRLHVGVVTVLVLLGLLAAGWALLRSWPVPIADPAAAVTVSTPVPTQQPWGGGRG